MTQNNHNPPSSFVLRMFWFVRGLNIIRKEERCVDGLRGLRRLLRPYRRRQSIALHLDRDDFETGGLWVHVTGDRAWVAHFDCPGGIDSYAYESTVSAGKADRIGFRIDNGQVDQLHPSWTVERAAGIRALEFFFLQGDRDPALQWISQPEELEEPARS